MNIGWQNVAFCSKNKVVDFKQKAFSAKQRKCAEVTAK